MSLPADLPACLPARVQLVIQLAKVKGLRTVNIIRDRWVQPDGSDML